MLSKKSTIYANPIQYQCRTIKSMISSANCNNQKSIYKNFCENLKVFYNSNCLDPCKWVICGTNEICQKGNCVPSCHSSGHECISSEECCSKICDFGSCG